MMRLLVFFIGLGCAATAAAQIPNYVPQNGLVGWWPFNGNANDESGNGNHGTVNGATLASDRLGNPNLAFSFDGVNDAITIPDHALLRPSFITISAWVLSNNLTSGGTIISKKQSSGMGEQYILGHDNQGMANFQIKRNSNCSPGSNWQYLYTPQNVINNSLWEHIVCTYDGVSMKFYNNSILVSSFNPVPGGIDNCIGGNLNIGWFSPTQFLYNGIIDDIGIWNRALTNCEIAALYQSSLLSATITPQTPTTFCQGGSVVLTASQGSSYLWSNGQTTQSITAASSGAYTVQVTNTNGCVTNSQPTQVTVIPNPQITILNSGSTIFCQGNSVMLQASGGTNYQWSNNQTGNTLLINQSGIYSTIGTDSNGCSDTSNTIQVLVNPLPQVSISNFGSTTFCQGGSVVLQANGATNYQWNNNQIGNSISVSQSGSYSTIGTDANGCSDTSNIVQVLANPLPQVSISNNGSTTFCQGDSVVLQANGASNYQWSNNQSGNTISVNQSGSYSTIGTDANGCSDTSNTIQVIVNPLPQVTISSNGPTEFCQGDSVLLQASGATSYQWNTNQTGSSISVNQSGSYSATGTDANGCMATSNPISVSVVNYPVVVSQPQDLQLQLGSTAIFSVNSQNQTDTYQWESDLGLGFQAINNGGQYNGANTNQLAVSNLTQNNNGQLFRCRVNNGDCFIESQTATLIVKPAAGVFGHEASSFKVLPNPTNGVITIYLKEPLTGKYKIKDNLGRVLMSEDIQGGEITLSVEHLPSGVYFVQVGKEQVRFMRN